MPVILAALLLLFIIYQGNRPAPFLSAFSLNNALSVDSAIWVMVITGLTGFLLGGWVWIIQPKSVPALLFAVSGLATLTFTFSPIAWTFTPAITAETGALLLRINMYGASLFGLAMCVLLLIYPSRLRYHEYLLPLLIVSIFGWTLWASFDLSTIGYSVQLITFVEMIGIVVLSIFQVIANRSKADKRAVAIWLSACVIVGSGPFIALVAVPTAFGYPMRVQAAYAFGFFNLVYIGFAIGLLRLRIFDLGSWAFQLVFHAALAVVFIAIDLALVSSLSVQKGTALTLSALVLAGFYLPIRGWLWNKFSGHRTMSEVQMFQSVIETGLKPSGAARAQSWVTLLNRTFKPVKISENLSKDDKVSVSTDGQSLSLPASVDAPALTLHQKYEGRALFTTRDQTLASQLLTLINQVDGSRRAYDRGVDEERSRIGRDIHDNIGAQLLQALHSNKPTKKDEMIRDSLSDLRDVINNSPSVEMPLSDMLADLRAETAERLDIHNIKLNWDCQDFETVDLPSDRIHALRSVLREAVSNAVKHSCATQLDIAIHKQAGDLKLNIKDNGQGFPVTRETDQDTGGHGLKNMKARIESYGGAFLMESSVEGTQITASLSLGGRST